MKLCRLLAPGDQAECRQTSSEENHRSRFRSAAAIGSNEIKLRIQTLESGSINRDLNCYHACEICSGSKSRRCAEIRRERQIQDLKRSRKAEWRKCERATMMGRLERVISPNVERLTACRMQPRSRTPPATSRAHRLSRFTLQILSVTIT